MKTENKEDIVIKEVQAKKDLKRFINFPLFLYKDNPYYAPPLYSDELSDWNPKKNPAYEHCNKKMFLAYKNNKIAGRIAAIKNYHENKNRIKYAETGPQFDYNYKVKRIWGNFNPQLHKKMKDIY